MPNMNSSLPYRIASTRQALNAILDVHREREKRERNRKIKGKGKDEWEREKGDGKVIRTRKVVPPENISPTTPQLCLYRPPQWSMDKDQPSLHLQ